MNTVSVQVNGASLHCTISGNGPNPVLLIPGAAAPSHWSFSSQLKYFGRTGSQFTAIAYDPRGYGYSYQAPRTFSIAPEHHLKTDAKDAHELMISLGYSKYSVLGWCDGGITAIHIAALFPESVNGIILWGSKGYIDESDIKKAESIRDVNNFNPKFKKAFEEVYGSETALQGVWSKYTDSVSATYNNYHTQKSRGEWYDEEMSKVSCKTLIFHGARDTFTTLAHARYINDSIGDSELCIVQEGRHQLPDSLQMNIVIEKFLNEC